MWLICFPICCASINEEARTIDESNELWNWQQLFKITYVPFALRSRVDFVVQPTHICNINKEVSDI